MTPDMLNRVAIIFCLAALIAPVAAPAQSFDATEIRMFEALHRQPNALARYVYLDKAMPRLSEADRIVAMQLFSTAESELGLYDQAVFSFPLKSYEPGNVILPTMSEWRAASALDVIAVLAADRHIVMINEAHHNAHTRELTLALLPRLRALGFNYFAPEALFDTDSGLEKRGYPLTTSGTEYLHEPVYGEIVREAIRLGFTIVPYDIKSNVTTQAREIEQAENLYAKVFAGNPHARLFVQAGYAHIDKARGRLGNVEPMAMYLQARTGFDPLSIDQTQFLESNLDYSDDYHQLISRFRPTLPAVLVNRVSGKVWDAYPALYDVNVILPPALSTKSFGDAYMYGAEAVKIVTDPSRLALGSLTTLDRMQRAKWLTLNGTRQAVPISANLCKLQLPCVVEAQYANELTDAIAADRYAFMRPGDSSNLYLHPGHYRLRVWSVDGKTLSEQSITVDGPRVGKSPEG
jgi:hypothetical protein